MKYLLYWTSSIPKYYIYSKKKSGNKIIFEKYGPVVRGLNAQVLLPGPVILWSPGYGPLKKIKEKRYIKLKKIMVQYNIIYDTSYNMIKDSGQTLSSQKTSHSLLTLTGRLLSIL